MTLTPLQVSKSYWAAEMARDTDAILSHFNADATFSYPLGRLSGINEIRTFYEGMGDRFPELDVEIGRVFNDGDRAAIEWVAHLTQADGLTAHVRGVNVMQLADGRYQELRVYYDPAEVDRVS